MRKICLLAIMIFMSGFIYAQPVTWVFASKRISDSEYELLLTAKVEQGWHIYAQVQPANSIAQPTVIKFNTNSLFFLIGKIEEHGHKEFKTYESLGIKAYQYEDTVIFVQRIKIKNKVKMMVNGKLTFQACTEESCLVPETLDFSIKLE